MAASESYTNIDLPLDTAHAPGTRIAIEGLQPGTRVLGLYLVQQNFTDDPVPAGAEVRLYIGQTAEEILLTNSLTGFEFGGCGHEAGLFWNNGVALAGKFLRLLIDFGGLGVQRAS
jgi:hypothetical protein